MNGYEKITAGCCRVWKYENILSSILMTLKLQILRKFYKDDHFQKTQQSPIIKDSEPKNNFRMKENQLVLGPIEVYSLWTIKRWPRYSCSRCLLTFVIACVVFIKIVCQIQIGKYFS